MLIITSAMLQFSPLLTVFASLCFGRQDVIVISNCYYQPQTPEQNIVFYSTVCGAFGLLKV